MDQLMEQLTQREKIYCQKYLKGSIDEDSLRRLNAVGVISDEGLEIIFEIKRLQEEDSNI